MRGGEGGDGGVATRERDGGGAARARDSRGGEAGGNEGEETGMSGL
ncbi:hypothetical protein PR002_g30558 [Phytophthora rubi]|uniref:Uncharacterized protein n=1 Tax=Phytophthora rubi TaxID=129364 RepID=A0A6A3GQU5_9STRA|nr:hypothetical protein PR002_g30558 [Phytophthora rubi]